MNDHIKNLQPYKLTSHKAWEYTDEERNGILKLDWNEASIPPSPLVKKQIKELIDKGHINWYPDVKRKQLLELLEEYVELDKSYLQYFASSDSLHEYITTMLLTIGKKALLLVPAYDNFRLSCQAKGAEVVYYQFKEDFSFSEKEFKNEIKDLSPDLVYICTPNNPTGYLHSVAYIESLLKEFPNIYFIIDEAYYEFAGVTCKDLVKEYKNIIITRTFSKAFGIANFRIGYMISNPENINLISKIRNPKNISSFSQQAAIAVLSDIEYMKNYVKEVTQAKSIFYKELQEIIPSYNTIHCGGGNFILISFKEKEEKESLAAYLEENHIFVRNLSYSYRDGAFLRITIGTEEQMQYVAKVIKSYYEK